MQSFARMQMYQFAEFLSQVFGSSYHFAYYDAEDIAMRRATFTIGEENLQQSISCTEIVRRLYQEELEANSYYRLGLDQEGSSGYRSNVFFLKNEDGSLSGAFVVSDNVAAKTKLMADIESMLNIKMSSMGLPTATHDAGLMSVSISSLPRVVRRLLDDLEIESSGNLTPAQKVKLIHELRERGAFKLKGAVPIIAQLLNTSIPTVYRYLNKLDQQGGYTSEVHGESIRLL